MLIRKALCFAVGAAVIMAGCGQKKKKVEEALAETPSLETRQADSGDIFNEYYEDSAAARKEKKSSGSDDYSSKGSFTDFVPDGRYVVQVSCMMSQSMARSLVATLESKGWPAYVAEVQNPTPDLVGTYYRVRIGGFSHVSSARTFGQNVLVPAGYDFWVDNRSNDNVGMGGYGLGQSDVGEYHSSPSSSFSPSSEYESSSSTDSWSSSPSSTTPSYSEPAPTPAPQPEAAPAVPEANATSAPETAPPAPAPAPEPSTPPPEPAPDDTQKPDSDGGSDEWGDDTGW